MVKNEEVCDIKCRTERLTRSWGFPT